MRTFLAHYFDAEAPFFVYIQDSADPNGEVNSWSFAYKIGPFKIAYNDLLLLQFHIWTKTVANIVIHSKRFISYPLDGNVELK